VPETISVLICTYNYARFLPEFWSSALRKTRPPDEIIVTDDGSTDETLEVMKRFPQVRYIRQKNQGKAFGGASTVGVVNDATLYYLGPCRDACWKLMNHYV
jgi:glycosyltransferase involved in cell wall biosynthesis